MFSDRAYEENTYILPTQCEESLCGRSCHIFYGFGAINY
ncbi:hypothetical protein SLEP1_g37212 [Rubroshorea leprosula]|uniref:Uncharacterized protein n=1 Tax=Rubroshorea leprosula TaxID=152421 RepID=A0AAV5KU52_9ROSI|nr:hypothetical protein SLEP1_g37212 [Rubroshorea leprosula]